MGGGITVHTYPRVRSSARAYPVAVHRAPVGADISQTYPRDDAVTVPSRETTQASHVVLSDILRNTDHTNPVCRFEVLDAPTL